MKKLIISIVVSSIIIFPLTGLACSTSDLLSFQSKYGVNDLQSKINVLDNEFSVLSYNYNNASSVYKSQIGGGINTITFYARVNDIKRSIYQSITDNRNNYKDLQTQLNIANQSVKKDCDDNDALIQKLLNIIAQLQTQINLLLSKK